MSQRSARKHRENMPIGPIQAKPTSADEPKALQRRQVLDRVLSHQGRFELEIDQEGLAELRAAR